MFAAIAVQSIVTVPAACACRVTVPDRCPTCASVTAHTLTRRRCGPEPGAPLHVGYVWLELLVMTAVVVAAAYGLARWITWPMRQIADTISRFRPTSLGMRPRAAGPRDETRRLADDIDAVLDRLAEGYEAQRRFASNASHELRTPLATQRALIEVSLSSALTPQQLELLSRQLLATNAQRTARRRAVDARRDRQRAMTSAVTPGQMMGLFEPFRRGSGERLDHGGGVGLGLTIARSIATAHGAAIDA